MEELRTYETTFVLSTGLPRGEARKIVKKYSDMLSKKGASIVFQSPCHERALAYPIKKQERGFYQTIEYKSLPSVVEEMDRYYRIEEAFLRFLTSKLDKHAVAYNEKKRESEKKKKEVLAPEQPSETKAEGEDVSAPNPS